MQRHRSWRPQNKNERIQPRRNAEQTPHFHASHKVPYSCRKGYEDKNFADVLPRGQEGQVVDEKLWKDLMAQVEAEL